MAHGGFVGPGGDAGVRVGYHARAAAGQCQCLHLAGGVGRVVHRVHLLLQRRARCQQQASGVGRSVAALQVQCGALQVVEAAGAHQSLLVAGVRGQPRMHMVGHTVVRAGRSDAQVLQGGAGAQADVRVQVLRHATAALGGLALVGLDEHAAHAVIHLQHQQGGFCLGAWLVAQLQPHGALVRPGFAGRGLHAQAQALAAQRAVGPGKGGSVAVARLGQIREQFGTLRWVQRVQPARL